MINDNDTLLLRGEEIYSLFKGRDLEVIDSVKMAYAAHASGDSCLPHSAFVRFPGDDTNRIIALPAYIGGNVDAAGIKWIASFPDNVSFGLERASATLVLNSTRTGLPVAIMEGSIISAKRTAASAVLAVQLLQEDRVITSAGLIGCGLINYEILRFLISTQPALKSLFVHDLDSTRLERFREKCRKEYDWLEIISTNSHQEVYQNTRLISFATTAIRPYVDDLSSCAPGAIILNISLRDLSTQIVLSSLNVVDDVDHVCRAQTSVHLAEQQLGNRSFIDCTIGEILSRKSTVSKDPSKNVIFSPFGLGVLDVALAKLAYNFATEDKVGTLLNDFVYKPWYERD